MHESKAPENAGLMELEQWLPEMQNGKCCCKKYSRRGKSKFQLWSLLGIGSRAVNKLPPFSVFLSRVLPCLPIHLVIGSESSKERSESFKAWDSGAGNLAHLVSSELKGILGLRALESNNFFFGSFHFEDHILRYFFSPLHLCT